MREVKKKSWENPKEGLRPSRVVELVRKQVGEGPAAGEEDLRSLGQDDSRQGKQLPVGRGNSKVWSFERALGGNRSGLFRHKN